VSVLGPTASEASEVGLDLFERAALVVSDFPEQHELDSFLLRGTPYESGIRDLAGLLVADTAPPPGITVFLSNGLTGTEVPVARDLARRAAERGLGLEVRAEPA
jgi:hypothetical protein